MSDYVLVGYVAAVSKQNKNGPIDFLFVKRNRQLGLCMLTAEMSEARLTLTEAVEDKFSIISKDSPVVIPPGFTCEAEVFAVSMRKLEQVEADAVRKKELLARLSSQLTATEMAILQS
jgi:hypothetical protein